MKRWNVVFSVVIALSVIATLAAPAFAQDPSKAPVKIYLVAHGACSFDSFWCVVEKGIADAKAQLGVDVTLITTEKFDIEATGQNIDRALAAKPDGLGVTVTDPVRFQEPLLRAIKAGIPVIAYNTADNRPKDQRIPYLTYIGQDEYTAGLGGGQRLISMHKDKAKGGVCVNQQVGHVGLDARCKGFADALQAAGLKSQVLAIGDDPAAAATIMSDFHTANPDVNLWLTLGPNGANPFYTFMDKAGLKAGDIFHGTFDLGPQIMAKITDGTSDFAIDQQPYLEGYMVVQWLTWIKRYGLYPPTDLTLTGPGFVTKDNVKIVADLAGKYR
jgi:simple sugar transport system substrate-binding protein